MERFDLAKIQVAAVAAMLHDALGEDERAYLDTLEGETNLYEWVSRLLDRIEEDEGIEASLASQIADRTVRKSRAAERVKASRLAIQALLECARLDKLSLPEATVSVRDVPPKVIVFDETLVPGNYCRHIKRPDMAAIKVAYEAGEPIAGVMLDNGGTSLTIRRK